jgi:hypothetical protein
MTPFHISCLVGFLAVGVHRYILSPGWNLPAFLKNDLRPLAQAAIVTALATYFAADVCAMLPTTIAGLEMNPCDVLTKAPKLAGFAIGAIGSGTDMLGILRNALELIPVVGPKLIGIFTKRA